MVSPGKTVLTWSSFFFTEDMKSMDSSEELQLLTPAISSTSSRTHTTPTLKGFFIMGTSAIWKRVWGNGEEQIAGQTVEDQRVMELQAEERKTEAAEEL